jgi:hypothetical protein
MDSAFRYTARTDGLVIEEVAGELLVFDRLSDTAHCLSGAAAAVWQHCRPAATLPELTRHVAGSMPGEDAESLTLRALAELEDKGLLEPADAAGLSRRQAMRRMAAMGAAAASVPLIASAIVTTPAMATSDGVLVAGAPCTQDNQCAGALVCSANGFCYTSHDPCSTAGQACVGGSTCCSGNCSLNVCV